ncbi:MAG: SH3 domain-containing protein [Leptospiraceae bacterium]|nr:SH3 domain-containing protein [Leptospiraceae bacterium]
MKHTILMILFALSALVYVHCGDDTPDNSIHMYVTARSGLVIRADSSTNADKLGLVPFGTKVKVLEQSDKLLTVSGKQGHWTRIEYDGQVGWSFGGFLSATPPAAEQKMSLCEQFAACDAKCQKKFPDESQLGEYMGCHSSCPGFEKCMMP